MSRFRTSHHEVPGLNTASLPDLIFTVLFFFMIVTHIRQAQLKVEYRTPQGTELVRLAKKSATTYIYIGRPVKGQGHSDGSPMRIQLNDKYGDIDDIAEYIAKERSRMAPEDAAT